MLNTVTPAAVGIMVADFPVQIVALFTVMVGVVFTETEDTAVLEAAQPLVPVPVTEYEVLAVGLTVKLPPVMLNALIPVAVGLITTEAFEQMVALFTVMVGVVFTETVDTAVLEAAQPLVPVPVTE